VLLKLKKLRFKGIGRFVEMQEIEFDSLGNMVQLGGENRNTQGSSGAGKSTVFNALDYLFGVNKIPSTVLKSRQSDEGIFVEGEFTSEDLPVKITRGKKLAIDIDGEITTGSSAITEEKLDKIIGMPRELFRKMYHKRQKEGGFFLQMTPSEIDKFLMSALGHDAWKPKLKKLDDKIKDLSETLTKTNHDKASAESGLNATQSAIATIGEPPVQEMHESVVTKLQHAFEASDRALKTLESQHKVERETLELTRPKLNTVFFDRTRLVALEQESDRIKKSIDQLKFAEKDRQNKAQREYSEVKATVTKLKALVETGKKALEKIQEISAHLKNIKEGKCYTCCQDWADTKKEETLKQQALTARTQMQDGQRAEGILPAQERKIADLSADLLEREVIEIPGLVGQLQVVGLDLVAEREKEKHHQGEQMLANQYVLGRFKESEMTLREKQAQEMSQVRGQSDIDRRTHEAARSKLLAYQEAQRRYDGSLASLKAQETSYANKASELTVKSTQVHNEFTCAEELKRAIKSYLSCSFDEALESIGENATTLIRHIPNMANATIQLEGTKETQDGKVNEEVNAVIHMDGEENIDIRSLCGGERTAADLAIDLSVIDLLQNRANKGIDIFVLDEPFQGLDTVCIEMALEILKNSNSNKRLVIVDHNPEVKEMVESRLVVVREGSTSKVVQS
jgi:DNA repair exonuclease SbcCD ATPase subunit